MLYDALLKLIKIDPTELFRMAKALPLHRFVLHKFHFRLVRLSVNWPTTPVAQCCWRTSNFVELAVKCKKVMKRTMKSGRGGDVCHAEAFCGKIVENVIMKASMVTQFEFIRS